MLDLIAGVSLLMDAAAEFIIDIAKTAKSELQALDRKPFPKLMRFVNSATPSSIKKAAPTYYDDINEIIIRNLIRNVEPLYIFHPSNTIGRLWKKI